MTSSLAGKEKSGGIFKIKVPPWRGTDPSRPLLLTSSTGTGGRIAVVVVVLAAEVVLCWILSKSQAPSRWLSSTHTGMPGSERRLVEAVVVVIEVMMNDRMKWDRQDKMIVWWKEWNEQKSSKRQGKDSIQPRRNPETNFILGWMDRQMVCSQGWFVSRNTVLQHVLSWGATAICDKSLSDQGKFRWQTWLDFVAVSTNAMHETSCVGAMAWTTPNSLNWNLIESWLDFSLFS